MEALTDAEFAFLDHLLDVCREHNVHSYSDGQFSFTFGPPIPVRPSAPSKSINAPTCKCGCPPWVCTGTQPCKNGCSRSQCHPPT